MKLAQVERMAREGIADMQFLVAFLKQHGLGYKVSEGESLDLYSRAAKQGHAAAAYMLSLFEINKYNDLAKEDGQVKSSQEWLTFSANKGFAPAILRLAFQTNNPEESLRLKTLSAESGYAFAALMVGQHYECLIPKPAEADELVFKWYAKAAELGDADGAYQLGKLYRDGKGIEKNETESLRWFLQAFDLKSPDAAIYLSQVYSHGLLGQKVNPKQARFYGDQASSLRDYWAESRGLPSSKS